jgi:mRNA interferase MazF
MIRGAIWWAELPDPVASEPGYRRPIVIILSKDSVANVSQMITVDKTFFVEKCGQVGERTMRAIEAGVRLVLSL